MKKRVEMLSAEKDGKGFPFESKDAFLKRTDKLTASVPAEYRDSIMMEFQTRTDQDIPTFALTDARYYVEDEKK